MNKKRKTISRFLATILTATLMTTGLFIAPATTAYAAPAQSLASQISAIGGLVATISPGDPGVITVLGSANVSSTINLNIDSNVTINWGADLSGSTASGKYLLNLSGGGTFNVVGGATIQNGSGIMTITGAGTSANLDDGLLLTPASGNGTSINIAASGAVLTVNSGGAIDNSGSNSAVNVTAGVTGVKININGGKVASSPSGYAINDGGTALCSNDTKITVTGGEVTAGSACAIKSTGATSELIVLGGIIENSATINSNPCVYMNGGTGDNVIVSGGVVRASDNNLGYGIQTTGNVTVSGDAKIEATSGRAVNLVGMDSIITVNGGSITATTGTAICTATTNPSTVQNTKIIINGGTVSTTEDAAHGNARAIYATGADSEVIINGGVVSVASDEAEAIYTSGQNSRVTVNGGQVWATGHFAIEAYSGGYVYINGGFVFAYGTKSLSDRVGASIKSSAIGATGLDRIIVSGEGVVAVWDRGAWGAAPWNQDDYTEGYANHLDTYPAGLVFDSDPPTIPPGATPANNVYWQNSGFASGIHYSNGDNSGFFALDEVFVVKVSHFVTVIGGLGTGAYDVGSPVYVEANPAPAGMEFDFWDIVFGTVYLYGPSGTFTMPDADVTIEALYKDKKYDLSVVGGSGSGSYKQGEIVQITAGAAPEGQEFDFWEISGGALSDPFSAFALYYMPAQDAQATAKYKDIPYYEFSLVGGSVVSSSVPPIGAKYPAGTIIVINAPSAFPAGYSFSGWSVSKGDGSFEGDDAFAQFNAKFVMPAADSQVTMNQPFYAQAPKVGLVVISGVDKTGETSYPAGFSVSIEADPAPEGKIFSGWAVVSGRGIFADESAAATTFKLSDMDTVIRASYEDVKYSLFVEYGEIADGVFAGEFAGEFILGEKVSIVAKKPTGGAYAYRFGGWSSQGGGALADAGSETTVFTMPNGAATVLAIWVPQYRLDVIEGTIVEVNGAAVLAADFGYFEAGDSIVIVADPGISKTFIRWSGGGTSLFSASSARTALVMPEGDLEVTANYLSGMLGVNYTLTVLGGTGGGTQQSGSKVPIKANDPLANQKFKGWTIHEGDPGGRGNFEDASLIETYFLMPNRDVTIEATYEMLYSLTVENGSGSGFYAEGERVEIVADLPNGGEQFVGWAGDFGQILTPGIAITAYIMPAADSRVEAMYAKIEPVLYSLQTIDCHSDQPGPFLGDGSETVTITPDLPDGKNFAKWEISGLAYSGNLYDPAPIGFVMPPNNVTIAVTYKNAPGHVITLEPMGETPTEPATKPATEPTTEPEPKTDQPPEEEGETGGEVSVQEHFAYVIGIGDGLFAPESEITRAQAAQLFFNLLEDKNTQSASRNFPDVLEGAWYEKAVSALSGLGIIEGYPDGYFRPEKAITRAEFVTLAVKFAIGTTTLSEQVVFVDVEDSHWAYEYITKAAGYGWIQGVGDGRFEPDRHIKRAEAVTITNRMFDRSPDKAYIDSHDGLVFFEDVQDFYWAFYEIAEAANDHAYYRQAQNLGENWLRQKE